MHVWQEQLDLVSLVGVVVASIAFMMSMVDIVRSLPDGVRKWTGKHRRRGVILLTTSAVIFVIALFVLPILGNLYPGS